jgi:hypothetical protein
MQMKSPLARYGYWMLIIMFFVAISPYVRANDSGHVVYQAGANETTGYARFIRLQNSGPANGNLLATFERWYSDGSNVPLIIRSSTDGGTTWSTLASVYDPNGNNEMFQPFLFEFPTQLGSYPAGTLLLVANSIEHSTGENFMSWRSTDHGASWTYVNTFETGYSGATPSTGVWEPFLYVDGSGSLVCVFSDERQAPARSQFVGEVISTDGGVTWSAERDVEVGPLSSDRPGMPTVAKYGSNYVLATENCGTTYNCQVHTATSPDGTTWARTVGPSVSTADGRTAYGSPYIVYTALGGISPYGSMILSSHQVAYTPSSPGSTSLTYTRENHQALFINSYDASGSWSWMGAPYLASEPSDIYEWNYSPALLLSADGSTIMEMGTVGGGPNNDQVVLGSTQTGVAPFTYNFTDPFASGTDAGWVDYGGTWSVSGGAYHETSGVGANKALAGPTYWVDSATYWTNYGLSGDVVLQANGQAGFLVRASNPSTGIDTLNGYYIGIENSTNTLFIGKENGSWTGLGSASISGGVALNTWYHITVTLNNSSIAITATPAAGGATTYLNVSDGSFPWGAIGIRDFNTIAAWRNITVM